MILRGTVFSRVLEMDTPITVVGPDSFDAGNAGTPRKVVYLLHGLCGGANSWVDNTMLPYYARSLNALFVLPEAGRSFYSDLKYGQNFFTYVSRELPELTSKIFNISSKREDSMVMGGSMGGFGALKCALSRPDFFGACCAFSPSCLFLPEQLKAFVENEKELEMPDVLGGWSPNAQLKRDFLSMFGHEMQPGKIDDVVALLADVPADIRPRFYITCGLDDEFLPDVRRFAGKVSALGFDAKYEEWEGRHNWRFFDQALEKGLAWYFNLDKIGADDGRYKKVPV